MIHRIKLDTKWFDDVLNREKNFEIRFNDRNYQEYDSVIMTEYFPDMTEQPEKPRVVMADIGTCIKWFEAIKEGWVVFSLLNVELMEKDGVLYGKTKRSKQVYKNRA